MATQLSRCFSVRRIVARCNVHALQAHGHSTVGSFRSMPCSMGSLDSCHAKESQGDVNINFKEGNTAGAIVPIKYGTGSTLVACSTGSDMQVMLDTHTRMTGPRYLTISARTDVLPVMGVSQLPGSTVLCPNACSAHHVRLQDGQV